MIGIVDYNMGNLASVKNAFDLLGEKVVVESDPHKLIQYDRLILPGVGAFGDAMEHLKMHGMDEAVREYAASGKYLLGICLGMQLLFDSSEEFGLSNGLGLVKGRVVAFDSSRFHTPLKVPHMGWNRMFTKEHPLFSGLDEAHYLYFVHSYHALCENEKDSIGESVYGYRFTSAVAHNNVMGIQPHPEKSHQNGLKILKNFINL
ncbi:MAG: imidazole glycerol phosphate synthase subunit HisH [Sulfuricurvum sp.]|uniref:imidazole glycerol phosphate synthase subunit HisH n=1 Tax=Sulfuricurvum sp. TaxID=2025608 RepID=UPI00260F3593|nr:imidazole glycerol phosphate synthase subunit HisH [Sulfuricurvum sp.]MDD2828852.1 imidazole glycerol phosphate synthase subunit HisH [Sulfuricurvum sp.]MDD4948515.1 imidazole glycerol phosphate synthase subunit HisH [Sulfuricurvum sp.]